MEYEIRPEPTARERDAIVAALERLLARDPVPAAYTSLWRDAGLRENVDEDEDDGAGAVRPPR